eukprot:scaffold2519_cov168-Amphora_coffeaeformis.AAC.30
MIVANGSMVIDGARFNPSSTPRRLFPLLLVILCGITRHAYSLQTSAQIFPSLSNCNFDTNGERRLAQRLVDKLPEDCWIWYNVRVKGCYPDFLVLSPRCGVLVLEVKDYHLSTIVETNPKEWNIRVEGNVLRTTHPLEQARRYTYAVLEALRELPAETEGEHSTDLTHVLRWSFGVVLTNISRRDVHNVVIDSTRLICKEDILDRVDSQQFCQSLWDMFPYAQSRVLSTDEIDRIRWALFPEIRVNPTAVVETKVETRRPTTHDYGNSVSLYVLDKEQEVVARNMGRGHRVIHGVAGSGKTLLLIYRALQLAESLLPTEQVLLICYNEPLAVYLSNILQQYGVTASTSKIHVRHFHKWCREQLVEHGVALPATGGSIGDMMKEMERKLIQGVTDGRIPRRQYRAILIDEGHDFEPEWLRLLANDMLDPCTDDLVLAFDDNQNIYQRRQRYKFTFKSVGIQAVGRTTILRTNYRNTKQILNLVTRVGATEERLSEDDGTIPCLKPIASCRQGPEPEVIEASSLQAEIDIIASSIRLLPYAWNDMAILCWTQTQLKQVATILVKHNIPHQVRTRSGTYKPSQPTVKVMTIHASKGLQFSFVAIVSQPGRGPSKQDLSLFAVGATRATYHLILGVRGAWKEFLLR